MNVPGRERLELWLCPHKGPSNTDADVAPQSIWALSACLALPSPHSQVLSWVGFTVKCEPSPILTNTNS